MRKRIEEPFGWMKTVAGGRKLRYSGRAQPGVVPDDRGRLQPHPHRGAGRSGRLRPAEAMARKVIPGRPASL